MRIPSWPSQLGLRIPVLPSQLGLRKPPSPPQLALHTPPWPSQLSLHIRHWPSLALACASDSVLPKTTCDGPNRHHVMVLIVIIRLFTLKPGQHHATVSNRSLMAPFKTNGSCILVRSGSLGRICATSKNWYLARRDKRASSKQAGARQCHAATATLNLSVQTVQDYHIGYKAPYQRVLEGQTA